MATSRQVLELIHRGRDEASEPIRKTAQSADKLGRTAQPLNSIIGQLGGQLGAERGVLCVDHRPLDSHVDRSNVRERAAILGRWRRLRQNPPTPA